MSIINKSIYKTIIIFCILSMLILSFLFVFHLILNFNVIRVTLCEQLLNTLSLLRAYQDVILFVFVYAIMPISVALTLIYNFNRILMALMFVWTIIAIMIFAASHAISFSVVVLLFMLVNAISYYVNVKRATLLIIAATLAIVLALSWNALSDSINQNNPLLHTFPLDSIEKAKNDSNCFKLVVISNNNHTPKSVVQELLPYQRSLIRLWFEVTETYWDATHNVNKRL